MLTNLFCSDAYFLTQIFAYFLFAGVGLVLMAVGRRKGKRVLTQVGAALNVLAACFLLARFLAGC